MLAAMAFMAFLCIFLGVYPKPLYDILPFEVTYQAYTFNHVIAQMQLLMLSALVFFLFLPLLKRTDTISLDTDWFYRKAADGFYLIADKRLNAINRFSEKIFVQGLAATAGRFFKQGPANLIKIFVLPIRSMMGDDKRRVALRLKNQQGLRDRFLSDGHQCHRSNPFYRHVILIY